MNLTMAHSSDFRLRWPLLVLMASIGLTAFAAFDAQRTARGQSQVVNRAIHEFSSFAAWSRPSLTARTAQSQRR